MDDGAGEAIVGDDEIAAPAEDKDGVTGLVGGPDRATSSSSLAASMNRPAGPPSPSVV